MTDEQWRSGKSCAEHTCSSWISSVGKFIKRRGTWLHQNPSTIRGFGRVPDTLEDRFYWYFFMSQHQFSWRSSEDKRQRPYRRQKGRFIVCLKNKYSGGVGATVHLSKKNFQKHLLIAVILDVNNIKKSVFSDSSFFTVNISWFALLFCNSKLNVFCISHVNTGQSLIDLFLLYS